MLGSSLQAMLVLCRHGMARRYRLKVHINAGVMIAHRRAGRGGIGPSHAEAGLADGTLAIIRAAVTHQKTRSASC